MSLRIVSCSALTAAQCAEIEALQSAVYTADGLQNTAWLSNEINFDRDIPCFFLGYEDSTLAAFLTLFLPTREEGEVVAFTAHACRHKGYFTALLNAAENTLKQCGVPCLLFAVEPKSTEGMHYLRKHFSLAEHSHTEWRMRCVPQMYTLPDTVCVECVTPETAKDYVAVVLEEYGGDEEAVMQRLQAEQRTTYLVRDEGVPVGVFAFAQGDVMTLFGVVVAAQLRGKGHGNALLQAALNIACKAGKDVELDVDSENPSALHLYRKYGFQSVFEVQYWRVKIV